jgi:hypothetical protein
VLVLVYNNLEMVNMLFNCCDRCGILFAVKSASSTSRNTKEGITERCYNCPNCGYIVTILKRESQEEYEENPFNK